MKSIGPILLNVWWFYKWTNRFSLFHDSRNGKDLGFFQTPCHRLHKTSLLEKLSIFCLFDNRQILHNYLYHETHFCTTSIIPWRICWLPWEHWLCWHQKTVRSRNKPLDWQCCSSSNIHMFPRCFPFNNWYITSCCSANQNLDASRPFPKVFWLQTN